MDLYRRDGQYAGVNKRAVFALFLGVMPNVPGFLVQTGIYQGSGLLIEMYNYAWFIGLAIAGLSYWAMMRGRGVSSSDSIRGVET
jgi:NCS1 family nucleobase:cation symporter-1